MGSKAQRSHPAWHAAGAARRLQKGQKKCEKARQSTRKGKRGGHVKRHY